jgi:hypothetical protein
MRRRPQELHGGVRDRTISGHEHTLEALRQEGTSDLFFQWSCNGVMISAFAPTGVPELQLGQKVEEWLRTSVDEHMRLADLQHRAALAGAYHAQVDPSGETLHAEETCVDSNCPQHGTQDVPGIATLLTVQGAANGTQLCALGHHAWVPWLLISSGDGVPIFYVTYCVRCRHHEQYDL